MCLFYMWMEVVILPYFYNNLTSDGGRLVFGMIRQHVYKKDSKPCDHGRFSSLKHSRDPLEGSIEKNTPQVRLDSFSVPSS